MSDTHTATVNAADFYRAALNASLFAGKDETLPVICSVHFYSREPGTLTAEATNRYVASQETMPLVDVDHDATHPGHSDCPLPTTDLDVVVNVKSLVKVTKMLKQLEESRPWDSDAPVVVIEWTEDSSHVAFTLTRHLAPDQTLRAELREGEYVKVGKLFDDHRTIKDGQHLPDGFQDWTVNPEYLALLAKVDTGEKHTAAKLSFGCAGKPLVASIGERFRALIMPMKNVA